MKKIILFLSILVSLVSEVSAQIEPGAVYPEITIGRRFLKYNSNRLESGVTIGIDNHSTLGITHTFARTNYGPLSIYDGFVNSNRIGVSYNYFHYLGKKSKWGWYINGSLGIAKSNGYQKSGSSTIKTGHQWQTDLSITPGIFYRLNPRIMLFGNMGGVSAVSNRYDRFHIQTGFAGQLNLGLRFNLGNIKKRK